LQYSGNRYGFGRRISAAVPIVTHRSSNVGTDWTAGFPAGTRPGRLQIP
jgi:hypothetical protein